MTFLLVRFDLTGFEHRRFASGFDLLLGLALEEAILCSDVSGIHAVLLSVVVRGSIGGVDGRVGRPLGVVVAN